jgi:steroid delta-isomerase-like uncharacterized protein
MSTQKNKELLRRYYIEILQGRNIALIDEIFAPDFQSHPPLGPSSNLQTYKGALAMTHNAVPDLVVEIDDQFAEAERVVTRWHASGTHNGLWAGVPATGKHIIATAIHIHRIHDGKIAELWEQVDLFGIFMQIGKFPGQG